MKKDQYNPKHELYRYGQLSPQVATGEAGFGGGGG